jgi:hypothetical protein
MEVILAGKIMGINRVIFQHPAFYPRQAKLDAKTDIASWNDMSLANRM